MSKKLIGIPGWKLGDNSFGITSTYLEYFSQFGQVVTLHPGEDIRTDLDLLVLPGGKDLNPAVYGEVPGYSTSESDIHKQYFYDYKLKGYVDNGTPIFGICLGFQMLAAYFGQKLVQHNPWHPQSDHRWSKGHKVVPIKGVETVESETLSTIIGRALKVKGYEVNSHHHQTVSMKNWNTESPLLPIHRCDEDTDTIETLCHISLPIVAVQYHPEEFYDDFCLEVVGNLLKVKETSAPQKAVMVS